MTSWRVSALLLSTALLAACGKPEPSIDNGAAVAGGSGAINLQQGWGPDVQQRAWFMSFGSRLIPVAWLRVLEQADKPERFMADAHMDALGFLVQTPTPANPDGFPVGFTRDSDTKGGEWAGLGCAACHTGEVRYQGRRIRLDGGAGMLDFDTFEGELIASLRATTADAAKFERFAATLKLATSEQRQVLRGEIDALAAKLDARHQMNRVEILLGDERDRNVVDVHLALLDEVKQQIQGTVEVLELDWKGVERRLEILTVIHHRATFHVSSRDERPP